jgi:hypothetical protein
MIYSIENLLKILVLLILIALPLIALIDILRSQFDGNDKLVWVLVVLLPYLAGMTFIFNSNGPKETILGILFTLIGAILYFIIGTRQKIK